MLFVAYVRPEHVASLPATTHVDGSARLQAVSRSDNALFWRLLTKVGDLSGVPAVLNTSFNVRGQPIVRTPEQAVATFLDAGLDALVVGRTIVRAPGVRSRP
jgi:carbamoyltransferase